MNGGFTSLWAGYIEIKCNLAEFVLIFWHNKKTWQINDKKSCSGSIKEVHSQRSFYE